MRRLLFAALTEKGPIITSSEHMNSITQWKLCERVCACVCMCVRVIVLICAHTGVCTYSIRRASVCAFKCASV